MRVAALDAETGAELWIFDPKAYRGGPKGVGPRGFKHRGVTYWSDGDADRVFLNSRDRLYAIDAAAGEPDRGFGEGGSVLLTEGHGRPVTRHEFDQTSPPVVFEDLVTVGSRVLDRLQRKFDPPEPCRRSTRAPASADGSSSPSRSRTTTSARTPRRMGRGATPGTPTCGG